MTRFGLVLLPAVLLAQTPAPETVASGCGDVRAGSQAAHSARTAAFQRRRRGHRASLASAAGARQGPRPSRSATLSTSISSDAWQRDKVPHAPLASDEEFARRAWLDATGRIPAPEALARFLGRPGRRISATSWSTSSSPAKASSTSGPTTSKTFSAPAAAWAPA